MALATTFLIFPTFGMAMQMPDQDSLNMELSRESNLLDEQQDKCNILSYKALRNSSVESVKKSLQEDSPKESKDLFALTDSNNEQDAEDPKPQQRPSQQLISSSDAQQKTEDQTQNLGENELIENKESSPSQTTSGGRIFYLNSLHVPLDNHAHDVGQMNNPQPGFYVAHRDTTEGEQIVQMRVGDTVYVDNYKVAVEGIYDLEDGDRPYFDIREAIGWDVVAFKTCKNSDTHASWIVWGHPFTKEDFKSGALFDNRLTYAEVSKQQQEYEKAKQAQRELLARKEELDLEYQSILEEYDSLISELDAIRQLSQEGLPYDEAYKHYLERKDAYEFRLKSYRDQSASYQTALFEFEARYIDNNME